MKWINSLLFRISGKLTKNYTVEQKEEFIAGMMHFVSASDTPELINKLKLLFYNQRLRSFPVVGYDDRLRIYGWFNLIIKLQKVEGDIVEAGSGFGNTLITLEGAINFLNIPKKIYAFDSFKGFPIPHKNDLGIRVKNIAKVEGWEKTTPEVIEDSIVFHSSKSAMKFHQTNVVIKEGFFSETIPLHLPEKISLLHIDSDLYEGVLHVLQSSFNRLQPDAVVIFDEYHDEKWPGVKKAVDEFTAQHKLKLVYFHDLLRFGFVKPV